MDHIEFVVADEELGIGSTAACLEPVINGQSLIDVLRVAEERHPLGYAGYAALAADHAIAELQNALKLGSRSSSAVRLLRCTCGDPGCSWAEVDVGASSDRVVWRSLRASRYDVEDPDVYSDIGPFMFDRVQYEDALAHPRRESRPIHQPLR